MSQHTDSSGLITPAARGVTAFTSSPPSALVTCQRHVLALQAECDAGHERERHLYEQLCRSEASCREDWPTLLLHYAYSQRQLLLEQHSDYLRCVDELLVTCREQHARREKAHLYAMSRVERQVLDSRQRTQARAQAAALEVEMSMAQTALAMRQQNQTLRGAVESTQRQLELALNERDEVVARVAQLEHAHRVLIHSHKEDLQHMRRTAEAERREHWITMEAMRQSYDDLFTSWAATHGLCDVLRVQGRLRSSSSMPAPVVAVPRQSTTDPGASNAVLITSSHLDGDLEAVLRAAEDVVRQVCVRAAPPPLVLSAQEAAAPVEETAATVYDHVRLCAQQHALLKRSAVIRRAAQNLQDDWKSRIETVEKHEWSPRVARKVLGQLFAARLDDVVHMAEEVDPSSARTTASTSPTFPGSFFTPALPSASVRKPTSVTPSFRATHQSSVLPAPVKPRFAF